MDYESFKTNLMDLVTKEIKDRELESKIGRAHV